MMRDRSVFVPAPIPLKQRSSHAANRISLTARFSGCARCDLGRASTRPCAAGTAGAGGPLGNPVPPREGVQSTGRRDGNDRAGHAQGGYSEDRPGPGLLHRHDPEAVHRQRLFSATDEGARHLRGRRGGDGPVQSRQRRISRRYQPGRHLPDWHAKGERVVGLCPAEPRRLLDLWECENSGVNVPPSVWDRAASWYLSVQASAGSWNYHRDQPEYADSLSMTAAGVGSLLLCKRQLERFREAKRGVNALLTALTPTNSSQNYEIATSLGQIDQAVKKGMPWLGGNYTTTQTSLIGQSIYYGLYGIERVAALADRQTIGRVDLLEKGRAYIKSTQKPDGSWSATPYSDEMNTVWAVLFLTKSTAKSIKRVTSKRLGAGTLVGGRYLPKDLTSMTVAGGKIMSRPMNGAVEGMLAVLEDPRAQTADTAVSGLIERYLREGPDVLRPFKDRFRKLLTDRNPGMRQVAAWALSRTADLDVVPDLIGALVDPEENVVAAAALGLQLLSRKLEGLGPPSPSTPDERKEAAKAWRAWYDSIRPLDADDDGIRKAPGRSAAPPAANPVRSPSP